MEFSFTNVNVFKSGSQILNDVSGSISPGELLAIMGPSGAGKTTLLNTLAGRVPGFTGEITLGKEVIDKTLKRKSCYVLQHDVFFGNLTLRQTMEFAAMIRLPDSMTKEEKMEKMAEVCQDLDLTECLDTVMGDMFTQGLSGGQKKRASIACELLRDPDLIFLDEPTTGLDSSTATSLISLLRLYAVRSGKTIIASIHQPSSYNFFQFNKLLLLTGGQVAYFGDTKNVVAHFESVGVEIDVNMNPADFMLEALDQSEEVKEKLLSAAAKTTSTQQLFMKPVTAMAAMNGKKPTLFGRLAAKFTKRSQDHDEEEDCSAYSDMDPGSVHMSLIDLDTVAIDNSHPDNTISNWPTGFLTQYTQLTKRTFLESRKRILDSTKLLENLVICAVVSLVFFQLPRNEDTLRDRMGAVFFIAAHWGFIPLFDAVASFPMERVVIDKERLAGWYRLSAYYLAKMTAELVLILIQPTVFVVIAYWAIGLNGVEAFFSTLATVFIDSVTGQSIGLFVGIACMQINQAMTISITFQMGVMLLGGLFTRSLPTWLDWAKYLSFLHYSFHSLMVLEFQDAEPVRCLEPKNNSAFTVCKEVNITSIPSDKVLMYYDVDLEYWQYIIPLLVFTVVFRILGYLTLRFIRKPG